LARDITKKLHNQFVRVEYLDSSDNLGKRIRKAKDSKTPYTVIIGDKDIEAGMITVETRGVETGVQMTAEDFIEKISQEIKNRVL
jgi:threonyl-tRNA synthetase